MYPFSQNPDPHEFLTIQYPFPSSSQYPTKMTAWLMVDPQFPNIPLKIHPEYKKKFDASTEMATGHFSTTALIKAS